MLFKVRLFYFKRILIVLVVLLLVGFVSGQPQPLFVENFSTYTSTADMISDPRDIYFIEDANPSAISLDTTAGYGTLSQSMRYIFPANEGGTDYTISRHMEWLMPGGAFPYTELWFKVVLKFDSLFTIEDPSVISEAPALKILHLMTPDDTGQRWGLNMEGGDSSTLNAEGPYLDGNYDNFYISGSNVNSDLFDNNWHTLKYHIKYGVGDTDFHEFWIDDIYQGNATSGTDQAAFGFMTLGANINQGPVLSQSYWWGLVEIYDEDPGWGSSSSDIVPPVISNPQPSGTLSSGTMSVTLSVDTDEDAACKYDTSDVVYSSMVSDFTITGGTTHSRIVGGLSDGSSYTYYARCQDTSNNTNTVSAVINFNIGISVVVNPGDLNDDDRVDILDIFFVVRDFGRVSGFNLLSDLNGDGVINVFDLVKVARHWGRRYGVDVSGPVVLSGRPVGVLSSGISRVVFGVSTNERSYCKYSTTSGTSFSSMGDFTHTNSTKHAVQLVGLVDGTNYTYYILCRDEVGNFMVSEYNVSFGVDDSSSSFIPDFTATITAYENAFSTAGDFRWATDATVPIHQRTYYDRPYAWYAFGEGARGDTDQQEYMDVYVDPNGGNIPPRQMQPDGQVELYMRNGDNALLTSLAGMGNIVIGHFINKGWVNGSNGDGRIQERALLVMMAADALNVSSGYDWQEQARVVKDGILISQNLDGSWTPSGSGYTSRNTGLQVSSNFMAAMVMSAILRYAEYYDDDVANIQQAVDDGMEWMWTTQWRSADGSFNYFSDSSAGGGPSAAPALNMLFVDSFGWLYYKTGDTKWITRGDEIFQGAINARTYNVGVKQFNQFFRNSWRYLYYRDGYNISRLQNPTEVHR